MHVNSHLKEDSKKDIERIIHKFKMENLNITEDAAKMVIRLNALADKLANRAAESLLQ